MGPSQTCRPSRGFDGCGFRTGTGRSTYAGDATVEGYRSRTAPTADLLARRSDYPIPRNGHLPIKQLAQRDCILPYARNGFLHEYADLLDGEGVVAPGTLGFPDIGRRGSRRSCPAVALGAPQASTFFVGRTSPADANWPSVASRVFRPPAVIRAQSYRPRLPPNGPATQLLLDRQCRRSGRQP